MAARAFATAPTTMNGIVHKWFWPMLPNMNDRRGRNESRPQSHDSLCVRLNKLARTDMPINALRGCRLSR